MSLKICQKGMKNRGLSVRGLIENSGQSDFDVTFLHKHSFFYQASFPKRFVFASRVRTTQHIKQHTSAHVHINTISQQLMPVLR